MKVNRFDKYSGKKKPAAIPFKQRYHNSGKLGRGGCVDGTYHDHLCPDCGECTSGTGLSRCPACANKYFVDNG